MKRNLTVGERCLIGFAGMLALMSCCSADIVVVGGGQAKAVIVTARKPTETAKEAADSFRRYIAQMTGADLPVQTEDEFAGPGPVILIGPSDLAAKKGAIVKQDIEDFDHYIIRTGENYVALIGNDAGPLTGTAYAVYDLLQRLGCGWFGADPKWIVIPKTGEARIPDLNIDERPAFYLRELGLGALKTTKELAYAWRVSLNNPIFECSHALGIVVPKAKYPEAWAQGAANPCLTSPVSVKAAVEYCRKRLDSEPGIVRISLTAVDSDSFCNCPNCTKAGSYGSRLLQFANAVARELQKDGYAGRYRLNFLAYWVTHGAPDPMVQAEPGVQMMIVNEGDHSKPLEYPEPVNGRNNWRELRDFNGWAKTGGLVGVYEWWIPSCNLPPWQSIPWYSGETALKNLRFWQRNGIRYMDYETYGYEKKWPPYPLRWPLHYVGARGLWDPNVTAIQVMSEACQKLYGPVAKPMMGFYQTIEQGAMDTKKIGGNWHVGDPRDMYPPAVQAKASAYLQEALESAKDPAIQDRIRDEVAMWDQAVKVLTDKATP